MHLERRIRSALYPLTGPQQRRRLITVRNRTVNTCAGLRASFGPRRPLPDFIVAGVQKGGTTFLFQELIRHPDVRAPLTKEIHFFDDHFDKGLDWYRGMFPRPRSAEPFLCGEASPAYIFHPDAVRRIAESLPATKLLVVLRDPAKRALSHYSHERRLGFEPCETFEDALAREHDRVADEFELVRDGTLAKSFAVGHFAYARRGLYADQLERAADLLGRDRICVLVSEEMFLDPQATVRAALDFIGAAPWDVPPASHNDMAFEKAPMLASTEEMLREYYRAPNARLERFLGRELPWPR